MAEDEEWVTQKRFGEIVERTSGRISQWISEGKITKPAYEGEGHKRRIHVERARKQLGALLDPGQQAAQQSPVVVDEHIQRLNRFKADEQQSNAELKRLKLNAERGEWVEVAAIGKAVRAAFEAEYARFEGLVRDMAQAVAAEHRLDAQKIAALMDDKYRAYRKAREDELRAQADGLPPTVEASDRA